MVINHLLNGMILQVDYPQILHPWVILAGYLPGFQEAAFVLRVWCLFAGLEQRRVDVVEINIGCAK